MNTNTTQKIIIGIICILLFTGAFLAHARLWGSDTSKNDVYYAWLEGQRILENENPYARILEGDMLNNNKYATYFPAFYLFSALTQLLGFRDYESWIGLWRYLFLFFHLGIGVVLFWSYYRLKQILLGFVVLTIWLFSNWAVLITYIAHIDFIPVFFLVLSLVLFKKRPLLALLFFSISLAIKQIAIFLVPLYLIWLWQKEKGDVKRTAVGIVVLGSIPLITSLPFFIWEPLGYIRSIMFSMTRYAYQGYSFSNMISEGGGGMVTRLPMIMTMGLIMGLAWQKKLKLYSSALLIMLTFAALTPVLFPQYEIWVIALLLLALQDGLNNPKSPAEPKWTSTET